MGAVSNSWLDRVLPSTPYMFDYLLFYYMYDIISSTMIIIIIIIIITREVLRGDQQGRAAGSDPWAGVGRSRQRK